MALLLEKLKKSLLQIKRDLKFKGGNLIMSNINKRFRVVLAIAVAVLAFVLIGTHQYWYFTNPIEATCFLLIGIGTIAGVALYPNIRVRIVFAIGALMWGIPSWMISNYYITVHANPTAISDPVALAVGTSIPFLLLAIVVYIRYALIEPFWRVQPQEEKQ